jgi:hypothetical protein
MALPLSPQLSAAGGAEAAGTPEGQHKTKGRKREFADFSTLILSRH